MLNLHCNNKDKKKKKKKKKNIKKKSMWSPRLKPRLYVFKDHRSTQYAMEANGVNQ